MTTPDAICTTDLLALPSMPAPGDIEPSLVLARSRKWKPGQTLNVEFIDPPSSEVLRTVQESFETWVQHTSLCLTYDGNVPSDIRVSFDSDDTDHGSRFWSKIGTQAKEGHPKTPTMNLGYTAEQMKES